MGVKQSKTINIQVLVEIIQKDPYYTVNQMTLFYLNRKLFYKIRWEQWNEQFVRDRTSDAVT